MKGSVSVRIRNNKNEYQFTLNRNITILCGDSGTGKTTLYRMVSDYSREGRASGVRAQVTDDRAITVLEGNFWADDLQRIRQSVVLVDEDSGFLRSADFARAIRGSSNYYLLITRNYLEQLPYSVDEIYTVKGGKKKQFEHLWRSRDRIYHEPYLGHLPFVPELIITEDSNAGYIFFDHLCKRAGIACISAKGKSNILALVRENIGKRIAIVADGAAFGAEIADLAKQQESRPGGIALFLPESFEWLILISGVVCNPAMPEVTKPQNYAESADYFSWERYFTHLLTQLTEGDDTRQYRKDRLPAFYLQENSVAAIKEKIRGLTL